MSILNLMAELRKRDIQLRVDGTKLRVDAPEGSMSSDLLDALKQRKLEVIAFLEAATPSDSVERAAIQPVSRGQNLPLSWTQQRLWFLNQFEPDSPAYNIPSCVLLKGELDVAAFERCLREIVRRHEVLRTTIVSVNGEPSQVVSPSVNISVFVINLEGLPEKEIEEKVHGVVAEESQHIFDLGKGPLLRATLLRASASDHYLVFVVHHIAFDGWSAGVLVREMGALYGAFKEGRPSPLPELDIQYADFAYWQRRRLADANIDNELAYWKMKLGGQLQKVQLPFDFSHNETKKYRGGNVSAEISMNNAGRLKSLCHGEKSTLFMGLLAAFKIVLHRYCGMEDIIVGCPIANRNRTDVEGLIGCFINTLALRTDLSGNPSFRELLSRVREVSLGAFANQDVPFEKLLEEIRPDREINRTPVFQVMFVLQNAPMEPINLPGLSIIPMDIDTGATKFDLNLHTLETEDGIRAILQYNADCFSSASIEQMLGSYVTLIDNIVEDPDQRIADYPLLRDAERKQLRSRRNVIRPVNPFTVFQKEDIEQSVARRFEEMVKRFPGKTAVKTRYHEWTYEGLNRRANGVANAIFEICKPDVETVALLFEHDADMLSGVFGALKAGKTYVPLDPSYPVERLAYMIENSQASCLISNDLNIDLAGKLKFDKVELININDVDLTPDAQSPDISISPDAPAYILYTSGSTGRPKGVVQNHRNVLHFARVYTNSIHICPDDRLTLISSYSFDAAVMDIFGALLNGATLYPANIKEEGIVSLSKWFIEQNISVYHSTPTVYRLFMDSISGDEHFNALRIIVLGGEAVYKRDIDLYKKHFSNECLFVNGFGPTESSVSLQYFINKEDDFNQYRVPVGYPVQDTDVILINNSGGFDDIYGEIGIKSEYLTLGYWNNPELTKAAFISSPHGEGNRIYRSGDLGRLRPDGTIEFLGRKDLQVKIRGYRIEVGEIEMALNEHSTVESSAVFAKTINGVEHLVGCVVSVSSPAPSSRELRQFLRNKIPDYMVPSALVVLDSLPLTPTNKIDRRILPLLDLDFTSIESDRRVEPRTPAEQSLVEIWSLILGTSQIGVDDNFFELGGHSLLAIQMISRIRSALDVDLPLRCLFENPTIAGLAAHIERMPGRADMMRLPRVAPVSRDQRLPLSFAQERLWFLHQLEPESIAYSMPGSIRFRGRLDRQALEQAFHEVARRHETLRTTFRSVDGLPEQVIGAEPKICLAYVDLRGLPAAAREAEAIRLADAESRKPFDMTAGPLFRISLYKVDDEDHLMHVNIHHIISDYWSFGFMSREFAELYKAFATETTPHLPELPVQYADFAHCQREWLQGEIFTTQLAYWMEKLGGELSTLDLPADRPRHAVRTHRGEEQSLILPQRVTEILRELSRQEGVSLFMVLLAVFKLALFRLTGQEDIIVGTPIAGRNRMELEGLIGFFINTIVMRTDLSGDPTFKELLKRVRETALEAYAHQEMPFEKLVEALSPRRDLNRTPLFQVFFNHIRVEESNIELPGLKAEIAGGVEREAKFDLTLYVWEQSDSIRLTALYNADLFDAGRIVTMLEQYQELLRQTAENPGERILRYSLITSAQEKKLPEPTKPLTSRWLGAAHTRFSEQAARSPEQTAVVDTLGSWRYGELERCSNQLANHFRSSGIQHGDVIAVYGHRSASLVLALLGILKAGAVFLILDPIYPAARLVKMLEESRPSGWLQMEGAGMVDEELGSFVNASELECRLKIPQSKEAIEDLLRGVSLEPNENRVDPDDTAYVIFTSGTTGKPKGIIGAHRPLAHFLEWHCAKFGLTGSDRFSMLSGLSHDPLLRDIFTPLWTGAKLCIPDPDEMLVPDKLRRWMRTQRITVAHITPALAQILTEGVDRGNTNREAIETLRYVFFGGDTLTWRHLDRISQIAPSATYVNFYGATETPQAMGYNVGGDFEDDRSGESIPLGRGIEGAQLLVLNAARRLAGIGEIGEIHVRTPYLSKGYLNDAVLTVEKFVSNPYTDANEDRIYRTGDLGRYLPDGRVMFCGRIDRQVSIRGFRVELKEIEAILGRYSGIQDCTVVARDKDAEDRCLVAYFVRSNGKTIDTTLLKEHLRRYLPEYMIPLSFTRLEALPLTPSGKIDMSRLASIEPVQTEHIPSSVAPVTEMERILADIWKELLGRASISVHDNFFELGGHSLLAVQMISRMRGTLDVDVPLRRLFENPTITRLASLIERMPGRAGMARRSRVAPVARDRLLPLSFAQERLWFLNQLEPGNAAYNISGGVRLQGQLRVDVLERALSEIIRRHEVLRTTFTAVAGRPAQVISPTSPFQLQRVDLEGIPERERAEKTRRIVAEEVQRPFDLSKGPLLRVVLISLESEEHILVLTMHHIITDAWSIDLFSREFASLYVAFSQTRPSPLPDLPLQYADFSHWQREWLQGEVLESQLKYWRKQLGGEIALLQLPTDRPRPSVQSYLGAKRSFDLSGCLTQKLKALSQHQGTTLFMTLLAAFETLLFRYTGQTDFAVGSPIANRNLTEIEGLIGFFVNTLVLRTDISGNLSFLEFLGKVRETALEAFTHQDMPFEKLVEDLRPARDMSHSPLFQVMFVLQNTPRSAVELPGLTLTPVELDRPTSQFDLTLFMWEEGEELSGKIEYNTDLFDAESISRLIGHFRMLLESIVADPGGRVSELPFLSEEERHQLLVEWNATQREYPKDKTLVHLFEEQVERSPDAVAVVYEDKELTYRELNSRANQLAHYLMKAGVGPEVMVGLYMERSLEMVIGIYAVIKAGGAYVPMDPEYPPDRIAFMIEDTKVPVLLTQQHLAAALPEHHAKVLCLDSEWDLVAEESTENPRGGASPENLAYVIYTSGSTGKPKGVMNEHRGIVNRLLWMQDEYSLTSADHVLQKTPFSFDVSVWEFFWPLQAGACLVVAAPGGHRDSAYLVKLIADRQITTLHFVPSMLSIFLQEQGVERCTSVKRVICSGEALSSELQKRFFERLDTELHNLYGPTEAAVDVTYWACRPDSDRSVVPIGYPVANTQMYVLGPGLNPVPIGCTGELHIGGVQVARGYLNRPELTAQRFIRDPFKSAPNARLYKTGDLARYLPDGSIEYLGRTDFQVKIRGLRVELGEIEARFEELDAIQKSVVVLREDRPGDQRLVAYYVLKPGRHFSVPEARKSLRTSLPDYMIPSGFEPMESLPLTSSGKVNRLALPRPSQSRPEIGSVEPDQPLTGTEKILVDIWKEALGIESISVHDNFFELGGHSLLSIQVIAHLEKRTGIRINPREFIFQTLGQMAASLEQQAVHPTPGRAQTEKDGFWKAIKRKLSLLKR